VRKGKERFKATNPSDRNSSGNLWVNAELTSHDRLQTCTSGFIIGTKEIIGEGEKIQSLRSVIISSIGS